MNAFRWLDSMSVGIAEFNADHRRIVELLGDIAAAMDAGDHAGAVAKCADLIAVASDHVAREDAFLRRIDFPGTDGVMEVQRHNLDRIGTLAAELRDNPLQGSKIVQEMAREFVAYLLRADINYKSFVEHVGLADC